MKNKGLIVMMLTIFILTTYCVYAMGSKKEVENLNLNNQNKEDISGDKTITFTSKSEFKQAIIHSDQIDEKYLRDFAPEEKIRKIYKTGKIIVTRYKFRDTKNPYYTGPYFLHFYDDVRQVSSKVDIFPKSVIKRGSSRIYNSPGSKYVAVYSRFAADRKLEAQKKWVVSEKEKEVLCEKLSVFDETGTEIWTGRGKDDETIFLTDDGAMAACDMYGAKIRFLSSTGELLKEIQFSNIIGETDPDSEQIIGNVSYAQDNNVILIIRNIITNNDTAKFEINIVDVKNGVIKLNKIIEKSFKTTCVAKGLFVSKNFFLVQAKYLFEYDLIGNEIWQCDLASNLPPQIVFPYTIDGIVGDDLQLVFSEYIDKVDKDFGDRESEPIQKGILKLNIFNGRVASRYESISQ
jgi:hypothetical protein